MLFYFCKDNKINPADKLELLPIVKIRFFKFLLYFSALQTSQNNKTGMNNFQEIRKLCFSICKKLLYFVLCCSINYEKIYYSVKCFYFSVFV